MVKEGPEANTSIFMTVGSEGSGLLGGTLKISGMFSEELPKGMRWDFQHPPEESHGSVPHRSTYLGPNLFSTNGGSTMR